VEAPAAPISSIDVDQLSRQQEQTFLKLVLCTKSDAAFVELKFRPDGGETRRQLSVGQLQSSDDHPVAFDMMLRHLLKCSRLVVLLRDRPAP
jgi:hypothetical protein